MEGVYSRQIIESQKIVATLDEQIEKAKSILDDKQFELEVLQFKIDLLEKRLEQQ